AALDESGCSGCFIDDPNNEYKLTLRSIKCQKQDYKVKKDEKSQIKQQSEIETKQDIVSYQGIDYNTVEKNAQHIIHGLRVVGAMIAKALAEDMTIPCPLNPFITECLLGKTKYKRLISNEASLIELENAVKKLDPVFWGNINKMKDKDVSNWGLNFTVTDEVMIWDPMEKKIKNKKQINEEKEKEKQKQGQSQIEEIDEDEQKEDEYDDGSDSEAKIIKQRQAWFARRFSAKNHIERITVELISGGAGIALSEENKAQYQRLALQHKISSVIAPLNSLCEGFAAVISPSMRIQEHGQQNNGISVSEFDLALCGQRDIDIADWRANTIYHNFTSSSPIVIYFWEIVESMTPNERRQLLRFVTGSGAAPVKGFAYLVGTEAGDYRKFAIALMNIDADVESGGREERGEQIQIQAQNENVRSSGIMRLPVAHSCFNRIDIPPYTSKQMLEAKLNQAIKLSTSGAAGFGMN
ncbi:MAG: putative E3 ubiquitin-protein ligase, partial [Streblomastix strix]